MLKSVDAEMLRQWTETYAAENESFCHRTFEYLRQQCMPEMMSPEACREKVGEIFEAERSGHRYRYSYVQPDWKKIGRELETLWSVFSLDLEGEAGLCEGEAVMEFFTLASDCDELFEDDVYDIEDTVEQGKELLLPLLRAESSPQAWKRTVLDEL